MEVHFLELPKLAQQHTLNDGNDPIIDWLEFLDAKSKGVMKMLAQKDENIKRTYNILQIVSKDKEARMAYEARQAEIMDQQTREKTAMEKGIKEGPFTKVEKPFFMPKNHTIIRNTVQT